MAFQPVMPPSFTREQSGALPDLVSHLLSGYRGAVTNKYLPRTLEADIFHKQISPLAMLASSPYFSSLHPEQQHQIAGYISQMLSKQGLGGGQGAGGGAGAQGFQGLQGGNQPSGQAGTQTAQGMGGEGSELLTPENPAEHFTGTMKQTPYQAGTAHRGASGNPVYTPTGSAVEQGTRVLREAKGLKPLLNQFSEAAQSIAKEGPIRETLSTIGSNIQKTTSGIPFAGEAGQAISNILGKGKLSNQRSQLESTKTQMKPALNALGFSDKDIDSMFTIYPGETAKNIKDRMAKTEELIERKIKTHAKNLRSGQTINEPTETNISKHVSRAMQAKNSRGGFNEAPEGSIGLVKDGELYYIPQDKVELALSKGYRYE